MKEDQRPIARPIFGNNQGRLPKSLSSEIKNLAAIKASKNAVTLVKPKGKQSGEGAPQNPQVSSTRKKERPPNLNKKKEESSKNKRRRKK